MLHHSADGQVKLAGGAVIVPHVVSLLNVSESSETEKFMLTLATTTMVRLEACNEWEHWCMINTKKIIEIKMTASI